MGEDLTAKLGIISSFNRDTITGRIALDEGGTIKFLSTEYDSGRPVRGPEIGTRVRIVYNAKGQLLVVRRLPN